MTYDLVGIAEIADMVGVTGQAVNNWRVRYETFPKAVVELRATPVFREQDIVKWLISTGRLKAQS
jgi:chromosome partitioning protein